MTREELLLTIRQAVIDGEKTATITSIQAGLEAGLDALEILNQGLTVGIQEVGDLFEKGEYFLTELMLAGRAMQAGLSIVKPILQAQHLEQENVDAGTVVIATIQSDIHDIGKNLVASMLSAGGFTVYDLGVDVPLLTLITKAREVQADIIAVSALLTTSLPFMGDLIDLLKESGLRETFSVMVGGASVNSAFAAKIGADGTAPNALEAVRLAKQLVHRKRETGK